MLLNLFGYCLLVQHKFENQNKSNEKNITDTEEQTVELVFSHLERTIFLLNMYVTAKASRKAGTDIYIYMSSRRHVSSEFYLKNDFVLEMMIKYWDDTQFKCNKL